ncbi:hypothetical protein [Pedobacter sp. MC2016-24]|uniref:hypothetical protein n=1 Tax=Pedobacter sp. MC2016-24 TaxID=2780090 RepID=UPI0018813F5C|nr:hypothetical protein [Pedobacter sp. MC2016-24]MBE9601920.1 hypothetical protein [Pedobacter sp. MC2016-24]
MKTIHATIIILFSLISLGCNSQNKETYWRIETIYRADKKPFIGFTGVYMDEIIDYNFHFIKKNDTIQFDLPEKFQVNLKNFKSLRQMRLLDKDYYEMYDFEFSGDTFLIKFKDNATTSNSKNTIIEFKEITKEAYTKDIVEEIAHQKDITSKIAALKLDLEKHPQIVLNPTKKMPTKIDSLMANTGEEVLLRTPTGIQLRESGDLKNEVFGNIKIGTLKDHSLIYDVLHKGEDYGLKQLTLWLSTDSSAFSIDDFLAKKLNTYTFKREKNSVVGYDIGFDEKTNQAVINSFFTLKYIKSGDTHIFIYGNVDRSEMKNYPNAAEMNKILNFNYQLSENISLKNN